MGENEYGCLGMVDTKPRNIPCMVPFFEDKKIIDICCGDKFSVVIAEVYDFNEEEQVKYSNKRIGAKNSAKMISDIKSTKQDIIGIRKSIADMVNV